jgi:anhydro-N-acetylmuramic acid kinase
MDSKEKYKVIGLMSGTSLDGLDIASCTFKKNTEGWNFSVDKAQTIKYPAQWKNKLAQAHLQVKRLLNRIWRMVDIWAR